MASLPRTSSRFPVGTALCLSLLFAWLVGACGGGNSDDGTTCEPGLETCACLDDGSCQNGLTCASGVCVSGGGSASGGTTGAGGTASGGSDVGTGGVAGVSCIGIPTRTCSDAACDILPGCVATEESSCVGTNSPCSEFDDNVPACAKQWGCGLAENGICEESSADCWDFDDARTACVNQPGCSWEGGPTEGDSGYCFGEALRDCTTTSTKAACEKKSICLWTESDKAYCGGRVKGCQDVHRLFCTSQNGCDLEPAACSGTPTPCTELTLAECGNQPGCTLTNGPARGPAQPGMGDRLADLSFRKLAVSRSTYNSADTLYVDFQEENRGRRAAGAHGVDFYASLNDVAGDSDDVSIVHYDVTSELPPFGMDYLFAQHHFDMADIDEVDPGFYYIVARLDSASAVDESEEENNIVVLPRVYIGPARFDLIAVEASHGLTGTRAPGDDLDVSVTIRNDSTRAFPSIPVRVVFSSDTTVDGSDVVACTQTLDVDLDVGEEDDFELNCQVPRVRGTYHVLVVVDPANTAGDADLTNNVTEAESVVVAAPSPDLTASAVSATPSNVAWKGTTTLAATVNNIGIDAAPTHAVRFFLSADTTYQVTDTYVCAATVTGPLAPGASMNVSQSCTLPQGNWGTYKLLAFADGNDVVFETNESNNIAASAANLVIQNPDMNLEAGIFGFSPLTVSVGGNLQVSLNVANEGTQATPPFVAHIYASTDQTITTSDELLCFSNRPSLAAASGSSTTLSCTVPTITPGAYWIGVIFDPEDELFETSENDNVSYEDAGTLTITSQ